MNNDWGIEIRGNDLDQFAWRAMLKPPFDPYVEEVKDERGDYLALRSSTLDGLSSATDVYEKSKQLLSTLNVTMSQTADTDPVTSGAIIEFISNSQPRKHHFLEVIPATLRVRSGVSTLTLKDSQGAVIEPPPTPSRAQTWMRAAMLSPAISSALGYLEGKPGWLELYKAYEVLKNFPHPTIPKRHIDLFSHTANTGNRRHHLNKRKPPERPMELPEARKLITQWISDAIDHVLSKAP